jgi:nucleotide-binding universal stress UspA family protein
MTLKSIVVATDFSLDADAAVAYGLALAKEVGARVCLLHVVDNPLAAGVWSAETYSAEVAGLQINLVRDAERQLRRGIRALDGPGVKVTGIVRTGAPAATIVEFARERRHDLIVLGSHGRGAVSRALIGSVAEQVARTAPCPVLVVPPPQKTQERAKSA